MHFQQLPLGLDLPATAQVDVFRRQILQRRIPLLPLLNLQNPNQMTQLQRMRCQLKFSQRRLLLPKYLSQRLQKRLLTWHLASQSPQIQQRKLPL